MKYESTLLGQDATIMNFLSVYCNQQTSYSYNMFTRNQDVIIASHNYKTIARQRNSNVATDMML